MLVVCHESISVLINVYIYIYIYTLNKKTYFYFTNISVIFHTSTHTVGYVKRPKYL